MNPFSDIEITPLYSKDGMRSQGKSVRIKTDDPSNEWSEIGVVSANYLLVHNSQVKEVVNGIAERFNKDHWNQSKLFFDGKRFVYALTTDKIFAEVSPGDLIRFGLIGYNSYDGSRALSVGMYAEHLVCSNGMTSETYFSRFTFRHHHGNVNWSEQIDGAFRSLLPGSRSRLMKFASSLNKLQKKRIEIPDLKELREKFLSDFTIGAWGKVVDQFLLSEKHTAFGLLDACTSTFWHNDKQSYSDYRNNTYSTDQLIQYSQQFN